jgi:hypothetical protein
VSRKIPPEAFSFYVGLGHERSYQAVADHFGISKRAVTDLAGRESWTARLEKIEMEAREKSDEKLAESVAETRTRHVKMIRAMQARALSALKQYPLTSGMDAIRAAEMTIKLERLVLGEASERTEVSVEEVTRREIHDLLVFEQADEAEGDLEGEEDGHQGEDEAA